MAIHSDYHLHSSFSGDCNVPMEDMIQQAIRLGLSFLCFTEHQDMDYLYPPEVTTELFTLDTPSYEKQFAICREKYKDQISLYFGVELGLQPHLSERLSHYVSQHDFDFIIGSSHLCHGKDPYYAYFFEGREEKEAYREYFESILENLTTCHDFDVYGHIDYVVRYGPDKDRFYHFKDYEELFTAILSRLISLNKGIEVNTGGIGYGLKELNPCTAILKRYKELGGEIITFGSDAHTPDRIGEGRERAAAILKDCGFDYYTVFEKRKPRFLPL